MSSKEKAVSDAATSKDGTGKNTTAKADSYPCPKDNRITEKKQAIIALLPLGKDEPIQARELQLRLGMSDTRTITQQISQLRRAGEPICASTSYPKPGYFLAKTPDELRQYLKSLQGRRDELDETIQGIERTFNKMTGQRSLWDEEGGDT